MSLLWGGLGRCLGQWKPDSRSTQQKMSLGHGWLCAAPALLWPKNTGRKGMVGNVRCSQCPERPQLGGRLF